MEEFITETFWKVGVNFVCDSVGCFANATRRFSEPDIIYLRFSELVFGVRGGLNGVGPCVPGMGSNPLIEAAVAAFCWRLETAGYNPAASPCLTHCGAGEKRIIDGFVSRSEMWARITVINGGNAAAAFNNLTQISKTWCSSGASVSARYLYSSAASGLCRGCEFDPHLEQLFLVRRSSSGVIPRPAHNLGTTRAAGGI